MASLNKNRNTASVPAKDEKTMLNHEGGVVHSLNALEILFSKIQGSYMGESTFYETRTPENDFEEIRDLIAGLSQEDAEYALKIAAIGRESNMISYPLAVLTACFNDEKYKGDNFKDATGKTLMTGYTDKIVRRGRDITDILANQVTMYGFDVVKGKNGKNHRSTPLPIQERKQLKRKLEEFDEYQIAKALGERRVVSMADAIKLLRPAGDKYEFFGRVIAGDVAFANGKKQVQAELSKVNNTTSKSTVKDVKKSVADTPLFVIVKNLVGMSRAGAIDAEVSKTICDKLASKEAVRASRVMPYQFYDAYKMFKRVARTADEKKIVNALVKAIDLSCENVADIEGYTAYFVDLSGSMCHTVSGMSSTDAREMAALLAAIGVKKSTCTVYAFANSCKKVDVNSASTVVDITEKILGTNVGGATYLGKALTQYIAENEAHENIVILTDGDCYSYNERSGLHFRDWSSSADDIVNKVFAKKLVKRVFVNNLLGNKFAVVNTDDYRKNLVTGFTEKYIDEINFTIMLGREAADIRKVIDILYDNYYNKPKAKKNKR